MYYDIRIRKGPTGFAAIPSNKKKYRSQAICGAAIAITVFVGCPLVYGYYRHRGKNVLAANTPSVKQDGKDDGKTPPKNRSQKPKPKALSPTPSISTGPISQGPCSNLVIGGQNNSTSTNCGSVSVRYELNGIRHTSVPGKVTADDAKVGDFQKMNDLAGVQDWPALRDAADAQIKDAPEWPTPYLFAGMAYVNLCDASIGKKDLQQFLEKTTNEDDYKASRQHAEDLISRLNSGEMPPQCSKQR